MSIYRVITHLLTEQIENWLDYPLGFQSFKGVVAEDTKWMRGGKELLMLPILNEASDFRLSCPTDLIHPRLSDGDP